MANEGTNRVPEAVEARTDVRGGLAAYERHKHELAQILREIHAGAYQSKNDGVERAVGELTNKLAGDRFYLTVVGQFSRGKSTLMNAILSKDYLPSGIVPVTSAITAVSYGSRERVVLHFAGSNLTSQIKINELVEFITERTNPGNRKRIEMAEVQVPVEILQRGFFLVDTPGLGSAIRENTATTLSFLPNADAIVFVTSCDAPLTAEELGYLRHCRSAVRQLFVVVNKVDLVPENDREQVIEFVKSKAQEELGEGDVRIYAVSARDALTARMATDPAKLDGSGLLPLQEDLIAYLTTHKHQDLLLQACDHANELLTASSVAEKASLLDRIAALRAEIQQGSLMDKKLVYRTREEVEPAQSPGSLLRLSCAVCDRIVDAVLDFFRMYQYELYVSAEVQQRHADAGGFCGMHTWQYADLASPQGICAGYPQVLFRFSEDLRNLADGRALKHGSNGVTGPPLPASESCPACQKAVATEKTAIEEITESLRSESHGEGASRTRVCLTHLDDVLHVLPNPAIAGRLVLRESDAFRRVAENLQRYALKHEGRRSDLITEEEWQAPKQALTLLTGHRKVQPDILKKQY
jgi:ribosome biogenesis GTPase A